MVSGGMPTLKATGRGRLGPAVARTPSTESSTQPTTSWKPKTTLNGSVSSSAINRGPPPQPPPANRKPNMVFRKLIFF